MTPTTDELRALAERLERPDFWRLFQGIDADDGLPERFDDAPKEAAAALRQWIAERERADALEMICKDANEAAMKHWPCNNPDRGDV